MANRRAVLGLIVRSLVAAVIAVLIALATNLASEQGVTLPFHLQGMRAHPVAWLQGLVAFAVVWAVLEGIWALRRASQTSRAELSPKQLHARLADLVDRRLKDFAERTLPGETVGLRLVSSASSSDPGHGCLAVGSRVR